MFYTNTVVPFDSATRVIKALDMKGNFKELLTGEKSKIENINYVLQKHHFNPKDVLFIDDNINHINKVKTT